MTPLALAADGTLRRALATADAAGRVTRLFAAPKPLYVRRDVRNADEIIAWAKGSGFKTTLPADDMHVTVAYSRDPVDWGKMGDSFDWLQAQGDERSVEFLGDKGGIVLKFKLTELSKRWQELRDRGCSWDYDGYTPHVTLTYENPDDIDPSKIVPYAGVIKLGPEKFEELDTDWSDKVKEHAQHDFAAVGRSLDALEARGLDALRDALTESRDALIAKVTRADDLAALANDLTALPRFGAVQSEVRALLDRAWDAGRADAGDEVGGVAELAQDAEGNEGVWRTIRGRRVFIREDETLTEALGRSLRGVEAVGRGEAAARRLVDEFERQLDGRAPTHAEQEILDALYSQYEGKFVVRERGAITAAIAFGESGGALEIHHLGSVSRGGGVGGALVGRAMSRARELGVDVVASVHPEARGFYEGLGFKHERGLLYRLSGGAAFAFDPNQPRDPAGTATGGQWSTAYHGTSSAVAQSIKEKGLLPKFLMLDRESRKYRKGVWLTTSLTEAEHYARLAPVGMGSKRSLGGEPIIVTVRVPKAEFAKMFKPLPEYPLVKVTADFRFGKVPPEWIHEVRGVKTGKVYVQEIADDYVELYGVVLSTITDTADEQADFASSFAPRAALRWLRATAFWVSGILGDRVLADAKGVILNGLKTGKPGSVLAEEILAAFLPYLGDPDVIRDEEQLKPYRLETIVRTNTTTAYNHGRLTTFLDPDVLPFLKGVRYSAILDTRTTEVCRYLDGKVFKPSDPNLEALLPPNHYQCRSIIVPIVAGMPVREDEFITPAQIGKARELADAKFLTQAGDAWRAYSEWDESKHPRGETTPGSTPGSFAPAGGVQHDGTRTLTDERVQEMVDEADLRQQLYGQDEGIDMASLPVADRIAILEAHEKKGNSFWMSKERYSGTESKKWDQLEKDAKNLSPSDTLKMAIDRGLIQREKAGDFSYRVGGSYPFKNVLNGIAPSDRGVFMDGYIKVFSADNPRGVIPHYEHAANFRQAGWSVEDMEMYADKLQAAGARATTSWNDTWSKRGIDSQASQLAMFSRDYKLFRTEIYDGWSLTANSNGAAITRRVAEMAFPTAEGVKFYNAERDFNPEIQFSSRAVDNMRQLKAETEAFYRSKLKTQDLSSRPLEVMRGVAGHVEAYTPGAAEAWTRDKRTMDRFGKMMSGRDGAYSALVAKVTYADVLWSWESAAGKPGWPDDKELKGKKEVVVLGARVKDVVVEHRSDLSKGGR